MFLLVARLLVWTLLVGPAADGCAPDGGLSLEPFPAPAVCPVAPVVALCVGAAGVVHQAWRDAAAVVAGLRVQALWVS